MKYKVIWGILSGILVLLVNIFRILVNFGVISLEIKQLFVGLSPFLRLSFAQ